MGDGSGKRKLLMECGTQETSWGCLMGHHLSIEITKEKGRKLGGMEASLPGTELVSEEV